MTEVARRAVAFAVRDARQQLSYRASFVLDSISMFAIVLTSYFLAEIVDLSRTPALARYSEAGYFTFAVTGSALSTYLSVSLRGFADQIRQGQLTGTLEALFLTPASSSEIVLWGSLWSFLYQSAKVAVYLGLGALFGASFSKANWAAAAFVLPLTVLALAPLGVLSAAFVMVWQRGDPIAYLTTVASTLLAGVYYPVEVLPNWLQLVSQALPLTHAVAAFRGALLEGAGIRAMLGPLSALAAFAVVGGPLSLLVFAKAVDRAKRHGTLGHH